MMASKPLGFAGCGVACSTDAISPTNIKWRFGCIPDTFFSLLIAPFLGEPSTCRSECDCDLPPSIFTLWMECLRGCINPTEEGGRGGGCGGDVTCTPSTLPAIADIHEFIRADDIVSRELKRIFEWFGRVLHNPGLVDPASGNLMVMIRPPSSGVFTPLPVLYYNSLLKDRNSDFGFGWSGLFNICV